jgi:hypothetical protein
MNAILFSYEVSIRKLEVRTRINATLFLKVLNFLGYGKKVISDDDEKKGEIFCHNFGESSSLDLL